MKILTSERKVIESTSHGRIKVLSQEDSFNN